MICILTDGDIHDFEETIDVIVSMSGLPVSIIIVGLGNEGFEKMEILDGDHGWLVDRRGNVAKKDLVQFVKFSDYKNKSMKELAEEVLKEVPD